MPHSLTMLLLGLLAPAIAFAQSSSAKIALIQYNADIHFGDYDFNLKRLTEFAQDAVQQGARILVFPEGSTYGYADERQAWCKRGQSSCGGKRCQDISMIAEPIPGGRTSEYWRRFASQHQAYVIFSLPEFDGVQYYNTSAIMGPQGLVAKYRKRELYYIDACYAAAGKTPTVFDTPYGRFGMVICADANSYQTIAAYRNLGARAVILPTDWDQDPSGAGGARPGRTFFAAQAARAQIDIYASDVSPWDGTGKYFARGGVRQRSGMPDIAIGKDGFTIHDLE